MTDDEIMNLIEGCSNAIEASSKEQDHMIKMMVMNGRQIDILTADYANVVSEIEGIDPSLVRGRLISALDKLVDELGTFDHRED